MPQKYDKYMRPLPGFKADPEKQKAVAQKFEEAKEKRRAKNLYRKFMVEPEELAQLEAAERIPDEAQRLDAMEGLLISRVARRKGFVK